MAVKRLGTDRDRLAVSERDVLGDPRAAGLTASQRRDDQLDLVAGLEALRRPAVAHQLGRSLAFKRPHIGAAVFVLDLEHDEYVWRVESVFFHNADALGFMLLIEHR